MMLSFSLSKNLYVRTSVKQYILKRGIVSLLNENLVLALLQASITGAGLILAVYALLIPVARQIFEGRILELKQAIEKYRKESEKVDEKITDEKIQAIKESLDEIKGKSTPPTYMGSGMMLSFLGYVLSILMSFWWLLDWEKQTMDQWLPLSFGGATIVFLVVGLIAIKDIYLVLKEEYEHLKFTIEEEKVVFLAPGEKLRIKTTETKNGDKQ